MNRKAVKPRDGKYVKKDIRELFRIRRKIEGYTFLFTR